MLGKNILVILSLSLAMGACVKKRPQVNAQGQNLDKLLEVSAYQNLNCTLTTTDKVLAVNNRPTFSEKIETKHSEIRFFDIMDFTSNCPFLVENKEEMEFRGEPNKTYQMTFKIEPNNLVVYKVVSKTEVSHYESPYSKEENGKWYVPVGGFSISSFQNIELARNADNKDTNQKIKVKVERRDYKTAKHFVVDLKNFKGFSSEQKRDVVPISYFGGEWYFQRTVVKKRFGSNNTIGAGSSGGIDHDGNFVNAGRIEFVVKQKNIFGISSNIDERLKEQMKDDEDNLNAIIPVSIPGNLVDYKREVEGESLGLREEEFEPGVESARYFKMDLLEIKTEEDRISDFLASLGSLGDLKSAEKELKSVTVEEDYFELVIERGNSGELVRYSFKRVPENSNYEPRIAYNDDMRKFGYFFSTKHQIFDERTGRRLNIEERQMLSRFNPKKDIVYHFSDETSKEKWVRDVGKEAINLWQQAFEKAGMKINIRIEPGDKPIGDIRYNLLNIITDDTGDNGGFGPSFNDALTGEVISAVSNIYTSGDRDIYFRSLRTYVSEELGYQNDFFTIGKDTSLSPLVQRLNYMMGSNLFEVNEAGEYVAKKTYQWKDPVLRQGFVYKPLVKDSELSEMKIFSPRGRVTSLSSVDQLYRTMKVKEHDHSEWMTSLHTNSELLSEGVLLGVSPYSGMSETKNNQDRIFAKGVVDFVEAKCPTVTNFVAKLKAEQRLPNTPEENEALWPCVRRLMQLQALSSLVHEVGHNLGLRHNFMGSVDKGNFFTFADYKTKYVDLDNPFSNRVGSSSIMDYIPWETYSQTAPGRYDVAALRFGYLGVVETENEKATTKIPSGVKIEDQLSAEGKSLRNYLYCTDTNAREFRPDPYCSVHDYGTTAVEMVKFAADRSVRRMNYQYLRIDRVGIPMEITNGMSFHRMKEFYDEWRLVVSQHVGIKRRYLQGISSEEYAQVIEKILNDPVEGKRNKDLFKARNIFVNLALDYAFLPNKYCRVEDMNGEESLIELDIIKQELQALRAVGKVSSCKDKIVQDFLDPEDKDKDGVGYRLKDEIGYFLNGGVYSLDPKKLDELITRGGGVTGRFDYAGTTALKLDSFDWLTTRFSPSLYNRFVGQFTPNAIDEPDVREAVLNLLVTRALKGAFVNVTEIKLDDYATLDLLSSEKVMKRLGEKPYANFSEESTLIAEMYSNFMRGLTVPDDVNETINRTEPFQVGFIQSPRMVEGVASDFYEFSSGRFLYITEENYLAKALMDRAKALEEQRGLSHLTEDSFDATLFDNNKEPIFEGFKNVLFVDEKASVGQVLQFVQNVQQQIAVLTEQKLENVIGVLSQVFSKEMTFLNEALIPQALVPAIQKLGLPMDQSSLQLLFHLAVEPDAEIEGLSDEVRTTLLEVLAVDITPIMKKDVGTLISNKEQLDARIDEAKAVAKKAFLQKLEAGQMYLNNKNEFDAQIDLLQQMMLSTVN